MEYNNNLMMSWSCRNFEIEDVTCQKDLDSIRQICEVYQNDEFIWDDISFKISMDWSQFTEVFIESKDINGPYFIEIEGARYKQMDHLKEISIPITISTSLEINNDKLKTYVHRYLLDLFVVCNLAAPGLVDFYHARLQDDDKHTPIKISNISFELVMENIVSKQVPFVEYISVKNCFKWYRSLEINTKVVATNSVEKSIFSLLHMLRKNEYDISTVPWIFHALEAIYGTNAGRGYSDISEKVNFLLQVEVRQKKRLKQKLRELNDLRSSFVHGGYNVSHVMDQDSNEAISETINFGISLIISSLQCLMRNNWKAICVEQKFVGQSVIALSESVV